MSNKPCRAVVAWIATTLLAGVLIGCSGNGALPLTSAPAAAAAVQPALCGSRASATPPVTYQHVIWIWMENHSYKEIIGSPGSSAATNSPYVNGTVVTKCGLATNYHNITHPSLPNYLASVAGTTGGTTTDCSPTQCPQPASSIFAQLTNAGRGWRGYAESMPANCSRTDTSLYAARHNPAVYYTGIRSACASSDVPLGTTSSGAFRAALNGSNTLPAFAFLTPNLCNDTHDCSTKTGDSWLSAWLPIITGSPSYQAGNTALFVTWDEGENGTSKACATNTTDVGCRVATLVLSPYTRPGTKSTTLFNHYGLLRTTETMLGLPLLGHAADANTYSMRSAFHL